MKISVGDHVKFLNDTGSGVITKIIDQKTAIVRIEEGFEIPCLISNLVKDSGNYETGEESREEQPDTRSQDKKPKKTESAEKHLTAVPDEEIVIALVPDKNSSEFTLYLVNSSSYRLKYTVAREIEGEQFLFNEGTLEAGIKVRLGKYMPANLERDELFRVQTILYNSGTYVSMPPLDRQLKLSKGDLLDGKKRQESDYFMEKAIIFPLFNWGKSKEEKMEIDPVMLKQAMYARREKNAEKVILKASGPREIDLHIEEITDDHSTLSNPEILELQLAKFRTELERAIVEHTRKIVFIHGVGNGKLKLEIRRIIEREYNSARYQDASFKEYGYGATMVIL